MQLFQAQPFRKTPFNHPRRGDRATVCDRISKVACSTHVHLLLPPFFWPPSSCSCAVCKRTCIGVYRMVLWTARLTNPHTSHPSLRDKWKVYARHSTPHPCRVPPCFAMSCPTTPQIYFLSGSTRSKASMLFSYMVNTIAPLMTSLARRGSTPLQNVSTPSCRKIMPAHRRLLP